LFWLFPRIATPLWGLPNLANQVGGLGDSMTPGQWLDSLVDDRIAFRVTFAGNPPLPGQRYWRGPVLWDFDGKEWRRQSWDSLPVEFDNKDSETSTASIVYSVSLEPTERQYLPVLDWPRTAQAPFFLTQEASLYSDKPIQKLTQYNAESWTSRSPINTLNDSQRRRALAFAAFLSCDRRSQLEIFGLQFSRFKVSDSSNRSPCGCIQSACACPRNESRQLLPNSRLN